METIKFKYCIIGESHIYVYTEKKDIEYSPFLTTLIKDGEITIDGLKAQITGGQEVCHIHFHNTPVKDLDYEPNPIDIQYSWFRKRPYVQGWIREKNTKPFNRTYFDYHIQVI